MELFKSVANYVKEVFVSAESFPVASFVKMFCSAAPCLAYRELCSIRYSLVFTSHSSCRCSAGSSRIPEPCMMWRISSVRHASIIHTTHRHSRGEGEVIFRLFPWPDTATSLHLSNRRTMLFNASHSSVVQSNVVLYYTFSDQLWTICMEFGKSATNFDSPHAESCPNGRRNAEPPKLPALFPNCMHCRLNWPEKGVDEKNMFVHVFSQV